MTLAFAVPLEGRGNEILAKMTRKVKDCRKEMSAFQQTISSLETLVQRLEQELIERNESLLGSPFSASDASSSSMVASPYGSPSLLHSQGITRFSSPSSSEILPE